MSLMAEERTRLAEQLSARAATGEVLADRMRQKEALAGRMRQREATLKVLENCRDILLSYQACPS